MSAWETVPDENEQDQYTEEEWDDYLADVFADLRTYWYDRRHHDRDGWLAYEAGSTRCLALGHKPDPDDGWWDDPEGHPLSWEGEPLCIATSYDEACTQCMGECDFDPFDPTALWKAVSA